MNENFTLPASEIIAMLEDARQRSLELLTDLDDEQLMGPKLDTVNPLRWEIGHVAFFHEVFVLRELGQKKPLLKGAEELYDSFEVAHDDRWELLLPTREETFVYVENVLQQMIDRLGARELTPKETYLYLLAIFHEDMHAEAFAITRQTLGYAKPQYTELKRADTTAINAGTLSGDVEIPGGTYWLGAMQDQSFVFDNEKWAHPVEITPFKIARTPVTNAEYAAFVEAGGYENPKLWNYSGRMWLQKSGAKQPVYWRNEDGEWLQRHFDTWRPLPLHQPVIHICWHEAQAYCNWAGRRLPTEAEWELAASGVPTSNGNSLSDTKRMCPWGNEPPNSGTANLDARYAGCVDVAAFSGGDSAFGCRQMIGNVWEWTASPFYPFPGYIVDQPYKEYSVPWFGYNKILHGGCWATRSRLIRNTYRNFFLPHRRDVFAGFRTCAQ